MAAELSVIGDASGGLSAATYGFSSVDAGRKRPDSVYDARSSRVPPGPPPDTHRYLLGYGLTGNSTTNHVASL